MDTERPALRQETAPSAKAKVSTQMHAKLRKFRYLTILAASLGMVAHLCFTSIRSTRPAWQTAFQNHSAPRAHAAVPLISTESPNQSFACPSVATTSW